MTKARHDNRVIGLVMVMEGPPNVSREYISLMKRTVEEQLYNELQQDYGFPRAICRSLRDLFFSYLDLYIGADRTNGQLTYRAVPYDCPPGVKTEEMKTHPVRLTLGPPRGLVTCGSPVCDPALLIDNIVLLEEQIEAPHEGVDEYLGVLEPVLKVPA